MYRLRNLIMGIFAVWASGVSWADSAQVMVRRVVTVTVSGVGASRDAAVREALQAAVQQVFGGRLESLTEVRNGRLSAHHVHLHTDGIVESYELLDEERRMDRVHVRLRTTIRRGAGTAQSGANVDGRRLLTLAESRHLRRATASSAWTDVIEHWCERIAVVRPMVTEPLRVSEDADEIDIEQTLQVTIDRIRYDRVASELRLLLDSVASAKGNFSALMVAESAPERLALRHERFLHRYDSQEGLNWLQCGTVRTCRGVRFKSKGDDLLAATPKDATSMIVFVQCGPDTSASIQSWRWYCVPVAAPFQPPRLKLEVTLQDEHRGTLHRHVWAMGSNVPGYSYQPRTFNREIPSIVLAPEWVAHTGTTSNQPGLIAARNMTLKVTLSLPIKQVTAIRRIGSQLFTAPRWETASQ